MTSASSTGRCSSDKLVELVNQASVLKLLLEFAAFCLKLPSRFISPRTLLFFSSNSICERFWAMYCCVSSMARSICRSQRSRVFGSTPDVSTFLRVSCNSAEQRLWGPSSRIALQLRTRGARHIGKDLADERLAAGGGVVQRRRSAAGPGTARASKAQVPWRGEQRKVILQAARPSPDRAWPWNRRRPAGIVPTPDRGRGPSARPLPAGRETVAGRLPAGVRAKSTARWAGSGARGRRPADTSAICILRVRSARRDVDGVEFAHRHGHFRPCRRPASRRPWRMTRRRAA